MHGVTMKFTEFVFYPRLLITQTNKLHET